MGSYSRSTFIFTVLFLFLVGCGGENASDVAPTDSTSVSIAPISSGEIYVGSPVTFKANVNNPQNKDFLYYWSVKEGFYKQLDDELEIEIIPVGGDEPVQITFIARDAATDIDYETTYSLGVIEYHPNDFQCSGRTLTHNGTETWSACGRFKQGFVFASDIELNENGQMATVYSGNNLQGHHHSFFNGDTWVSVALSSVNAGLSSGLNSMVALSKSGNSAILISDVNGVNVLYFQNGSLLYTHLLGKGYRHRRSHGSDVLKPIKFVNDDELVVLASRSNDVEMVYFDQTGLIRTETVLTERSIVTEEDYQIVVGEESKLVIVGDQSLHFSVDGSWKQVDLPIYSRFSTGTLPLTLEYDNNGYVSVFLEEQETNRPVDNQAPYFRIKINQNGDYLELNTPLPNQGSIAINGATSGFFANCNTFLVGDSVCEDGEFSFYTIENNVLDVHDDELPMYQGERLNSVNFVRIYATNGTWRTIAFLDNRFQIFERVGVQWIHRETIDAKRGHGDNKADLDITANGYMGLAGSFVQKQYCPCGIVDEYFVGLFKFD